MTTLKKIVSTVLGIPETSITSELSRENTPEWDSFNHLMLISEIEKELGIQIMMSEVEKIKTFADLEKLVSRS